MPSTLAHRQQTNWEYYHSVHTHTHTNPSSIKYNKASFRFIAVQRRYLNDSQEKKEQLKCRIYLRYK